MLCAAPDEIINLGRKLIRKFTQISRYFIYICTK